MDDSAIMAFMALDPISANELFSDEEARKLVSDVIRKANEQADSSNVAKYGRRAEVAYEAVKLLHAAKVARLQGI
jgi:polyhydroxyalkanoate synthesis regulator phasin